MSSGAAMSLFGFGFDTAYSDRTLGVRMMTAYRMSQPVPGLFNGTQERLLRSVRNADSSTSGSTTVRMSFATGMQHASGG